MHEKIKVKFSLPKTDFDEIMANMPTKEQVALLRKAQDDKVLKGFDEFKEFISEKVLEVKAGYGTLVLTLQAFGAKFRRFQIYAHVRMEGCQDSGSHAFATIDPEDIYAKNGFDLHLFDGGLDVVNVRFVSE